MFIAKNHNREVVEWRRRWWLLLLLLLQLCCVNAQRGCALDSFEILVGTWEVSITARNQRCMDVIFPPRTCKEEEEEEEEEEDVIDVMIHQHTNTDKDRDNPLLRDRHRSGRRLLQSQRCCDCHLCLFPNRTFALEPMIAVTASSEMSSISRNSNNPDRLTLRGEWTVLSNPYCITDRFFDNVHLTSYPRSLIQQQQVVQRSSSSSCSSRRRQSVFQRRNRRRKKPWRRRFFQRRERKAAETMITTTSNNTTTTLQRIKLHMHGNVLGHYSAGGWLKMIRGPDHRFKRGRIRNGVMIMESLPVANTVEVESSSLSSSLTSQRSRSRSNSIAATTSVVTQCHFPRWMTLMKKEPKTMMASFSARRSIPCFQQQRIEDDDHLDDDQDLPDFS